MSSYRERLRNRTRETVHNKDMRGGGRKSLLDLSIIKLPVWVPKTGRDKNYIDIMPWKISQSWYKFLRERSGKPTGLEVGEWNYKLEVPRHSNLGPSKDLAVCIREAFGKTDPPCEDMFAEYQKKRDGSKDFSEKKVIALRPSWRDFYVIYDYDQREKGYMLWEIAYEMFEKYLLDEIKDDENLVPWDLEDGRSIEFRGREKRIGDGPVFVEAEGITLYKRDPLPESELDKIPSLDAAIVIPDYEDIRNLYYGLEPEEEKEKETEKPKDEPASRTRTRGSEGPAAESKPPERARDTSPPAPGTCPAGGTLGVDCGRLEACQKEVCDNTTYELCIKKRDEGKKEPPPEPPKKEEPASASRSRSRGEPESPAPSSGRKRR
jgi:hypothetical protein